MTLKNRQLIKITLSFAFVFLIAIPASSQEMKIGVVNLQAIAERSPQTKAVMESLREEFAPRDREILATQQQITDLQEKAQKDQYKKQ